MTNFLVQWGINPWGEDTPIHAQWALVYIALAFGVGFMLAHTLFVKFWPKPAEATAPVNDAAAARVPARVARHSLAARTFAILQKHLSGIFLVSEEEIVGAMALIWERLKVITEPSSAIALAPLLKPEIIERIRRDRAASRRLKIGIILSGGNVDLRALPFQ